MNLGLWPVRVKVNPMLLVLAWAALTLVLWAVVGARDDPPEWDEPEELPQSDFRVLWLSDNLTAADVFTGPVSIRWRQ